MCKIQIVKDGAIIFEVENPTIELLTETYEAKSKHRNKSGALEEYTVQKITGDTKVKIDGIFRPVSLSL